MFFPSLTHKQAEIFLYASATSGDVARGILSMHEFEEVWLRLAHLAFPHHHLAAAIKVKALFQNVKLAYLKQQSTARNIHVRAQVLVIIIIIIFLHFFVIHRLYKEHLTQKIIFFSLFILFLIIHFCCKTSSNNPPRATLTCAPR
jgi:hypothetical protein